ncbi:MAG: flagellar biosynthesis anti-sigma factor FlgM [Steroidobacteraceae bacterium]
MRLPGDSVVTTKISSMETKPVRVAPGAPVHKRLDQAASSAESSSEAASDVQLTGTARGLASIEQSLHALPAIDEQRVAAVRQRLERGDYKVDPQRVADRMLHLESDLARGNPLNRNPLK